MSARDFTRPDQRPSEIRRNLRQSRLARRLLPMMLKVAADSPAGASRPKAPLLPG
jgi:hypothetical protein